MADRETQIIEGLRKKFSSRLPSGVLGIGDDCAVFPFSKKLNALVTKDLLVEGIHFLRGGISAEDLGHKSLAVNLSDIAAMGGIAKYVFLSVAFPTKTSEKWLRDFVDGFSKLARKENVFLLGGDTSRSLRDITISVTVVGFVKKKEIKLRSMARENDLVCVTGNLGSSAAGLKIVSQKIKPNKVNRELLRIHLRPVACTQEGPWLAQWESVHAMMDLSDGLAADLPKILNESKKSKELNCGAEIDVDRIPMSEELVNFCDRENLDPYNSLKLAIEGGEDYELLLTVAEKDFPKIKRNFEKKFSKKLTAIGRINSTKKLTWIKNNRILKDKFTGFRHF